MLKRLPPLTLDTLEDHMVFVEGRKFVRRIADVEFLVQLDDFYMCRFLVTQALWEEVMGTNPSLLQHPARPVERVSWQDCQAFLAKLKELTGKNYVLPTEAQWEYAARGGKYEKNYLYSGGPNIEEIGWRYNSSMYMSQYVGLKKPNQLGLYDMSGNVLEWCSDRHNRKYYAQCAELGIVENPLGADSIDPGYIRGIDYRIVMGGSYRNEDEVYFRCSYPLGYEVSENMEIFGLRLVVNID